LDKQNEDENEALLTTLRRKNGKGSPKVICLWN
jgi:hypothetical protein